MSLPDSWASRGVPPGIGWYRTSFALNLPRGSYVPVDVQIGGPGPGAGSADYRAFIYVNGWLIGRYVNNVGPQHQFYVPAGILNDQGGNTLAIAVWGMDATGGGLDQVSLVAAGNQAGGVPVRPVLSPGYSAAVYGPPSSPQPSLAAVPSSALAEGTFTVKATLSNPAPQPLRNASILLNAPAGWQVSPSGPAAPGHGGRWRGRVGQLPGHRAVLGAEPGPGRPAGQGHVQRGRSGWRYPDADQQRGRHASRPRAWRRRLTTPASPTTPTPARRPTSRASTGEGTTFSAQGLAADNLTPGASVTAGGLTFTWPNEPSAQPDNTMAEGQTIALSGSGGTLGFLAAANNSAESGTGTIYYTDGSTQTFTLSVGNFWYPSGQDGNPSNTQVAGVDYANYPTGSSGHEVYVFEQSVSLAVGQDGRGGDAALAGRRGRLQPGAAHLRHRGRLRPVSSAARIVFR